MALFQHAAFFMSPCLVTRGICLRRRSGCSTLRNVRRRDPWTWSLVTVCLLHYRHWSPRGARILTAFTALLLTVAAAHSATTWSERSLDDSVHATTGAGQIAERPARMSIRSGHRLREYFLFVPGSIAPDMPAPVLLLLHGSYSTPLDVLPQWTDVAQRAGVILAAPKSIVDYGWRIHDDAPTLLRDIVDDIATRRPIDRRRLYLFGHSGGAVHALTLGLLESQYFAAVAVHAGALRDRGSFKLIPLAKRKIPVWITIGDRDQFFMMKDVTATEAALRDGGFPVALTIIKGHDHSYTDVSPSVNRAAWAFLEPIELSQSPVFQSYQ
jgi:predicted esterase